MEIKIIDTEEMANFFWSALVKLGYSPTEEELEDIADVCFDYLYELGIIEEYKEY